MQPNRNETCPCGSGKKFKKCCLNRQDAPVDILWRQLSSIHDTMAGRLLDHATAEFGAESFDEAWEKFWLGEEPQEPFDPRSPRNQLFFPFYLYNWFREEPGVPFLIAPENRTVAKDFLAVRGRSLSELERRFLQASIDAPFSFHEIVEVDPGKGFVLRDIMLGTEEWVSERSGSQTVTAGEIFYGKIVKIDHVAMLCGCGWIVLPPTSMLEVTELRKKVRKFVKKSRRELDQLALHLFSESLRNLFLAIEQALMSPPRLCNTEGDPLAHHRITYAVPSAQEAFDALAELSLVISKQDMLDDSERDENDELRKVTIDWHRRGNKDHKNWDNTVLGRLTIDGEKLSIEVNSAKRAKKIKAEVKKRLGARAVHKSTVVQSTESLVNESKQKLGRNDEAQEERERQELMQSPEIQAQLREMMVKHWESWYREKIPALGNRTPLQASKTVEGRELLQSLLLDYERQDRKQENPALKANVPAIRERLGLPPREE